MSHLIVECPACRVQWDMDFDPVACICGSEEWMVYEVDDEVVE